MTSHSEDLWRMFRRVAEMPFGAGQIAAVEQLIRQVDAAGDAELAFAARMLGTNAYVYGGEPAKSFVTFSWCLADFDRVPQPYHQRYQHNLLWHFKYMVNALLNFPEIPLERTQRVLSEMERRYRDGGHSLQAVYKYRHRVARHLGAADEAEEWYRRWITAHRDDLSDCAGCDPSSQVQHLAATGRDEEAVALAEPVLAGRLTCREQPQGILTSLLLPYLRSGRRDAARDAHRRAYRRIQGNIADLWDIGDHIEFCVLTDNDVRGLELVQRHIDWLDRAPSPAAAMEFSAAAALVLRRLAAAGHDDLTVHRRAYGDRPAQDVPVPVLADELAGLARDLAARFDARNGTSAQSESIERRMAAEPIGEHLPLSATSRRRVRPELTALEAAQLAALDVAHRPASADPPSQRSSAPRALPQPSPLAELPPDATPAELLELAVQCWRTERYADLQAVLRRCDERIGDAELSLPLTALRTEFRAVERHMRGDLAGAQEASREAIALHRRVPDPVREQVVSGRLGVLLCLGGEATEGLPLVKAAAAYLAEQGDAEQRASGFDRLAVAHAELGQWTDALDALDRAAEAVAETGDPYLEARIALRRARCLTELERSEDAAPAAARARDLYWELGLAEHHAAAALSYAQALTDPQLAVPAYDEALAVATAQSVLPARTGRARALLAADRVGEAIEDFVEAVALCTERDIADGSAYLRWELAGAYRRVGRMADAAEAAEEAVAELDRLGHQADADRCRHLLAGVYVSLGEDDQALQLLDRLAENLDGPDNLPGRAQVLEEAGDLLYRRDRDMLAAERFAAAANAYRLAELPVDEMRAHRRHAAALHWSGQSDAALRALDRADERFATLPAEMTAEPALLWERAMLADTAARILVGVDRPEEALDRIRGVPDRLRSIQAFGEALQIDLLIGEVLLRLNRPGEAEPVLRAALGGIPDRAELARRAAWLLAQALAGLGRQAEADALRSEYDLTGDGDGEEYDE